MVIRTQLWQLALGGILLIALGAGVGGLVLNRSSVPAVPPVERPLSQLLADAHSLLDTGQLDEAEKNYRAVLVSQAGNAEAITHIGNIAARRGDRVIAMRQYDEALQADPAYIHALWDKALLLRDMGDEVAAIQTWQSFLTLVSADSPDAATVKKWIAESQARLAVQIGIGHSTQTAAKPAQKNP